MCGLIVIIGQHGAAPSPELLKPALQQMHNRGPDAEGLWSEENCAMGHRRLAIMDLDPRAQQPMHSA